MSQAEREIGTLLQKFARGQDGCLVIGGQRTLRAKLIGDPALGEIGRFPVDKHTGLGIEELDRVLVVEQARAWVVVLDPVGVEYLSRGGLEVPIYRVHWAAARFVYHWVLAPSK